MKQLYLSDTFREFWKGKDPFAAVTELEGRIFRCLKSRKTIRFTLHDRAYFAKIHYGIGWYAFFKDLFQLKIPVLGARHEWMALNRLHEIGVETIRPVAFGARGWNPVRIQSFIITEALTETRNLEDVCNEWTSSPPSLHLKKALIVRVASMVRQMHIHGMNHRDCYICHFHVDVSSLQGDNNPTDQHVYVIDLHRAQMRQCTPQRWLIKDLAGLYFSAMDFGLTRSDLFRFIKAYEQRPLRVIFLRDKRFWRRVERKAVALYKKHFGGIPVNICNFARSTT